MDPRKLILPSSVTFDQALVQYESAPPGAIVIAYEQAADLLASRYYRFLAIRPPLAIVLVRPTIGLFELNQFTIPFLLIEGDRVRSFNDHEHAVKRHEARYGDGTQRVLLGLEGKELDEVIDTWLDSVVETKIEREAAGPSLDDRKDQAL